MNVAVWDHQAKSRLLVRALVDAGHTIVGDPAESDLFLIDIDWGYDRRRAIGEAYAAGATVIQYPHGANHGFHHLLQRPDDRIAAVLVHAPGIADVLEASGHPGPFHVVGWSYSPVVYQPYPPRIRKVLFGPRHPFGDGTLSEREREMNRKVAGRLAELDVEVTVQSYLPPEANGFTPPAGWRCEASDLDICWRHIDEADAVVTSGTLAFLAVARGKPTVFMGQDEPLRDNREVVIPGAAPFQRLMRYPFDTEDGPLEIMLERARIGALEVAGWQRRFVGAPFKPAAFVDLVESLTRVEAAV